MGFKHNLGRKHSLALSEKHLIFTRLSRRNEEPSEALSNRYHFPMGGRCQKRERQRRDFQSLAYRAGGTPNNFKGSPFKSFWGLQTPYFIKNGVDFFFSIISRFWKTHRKLKEKNHIF